MRLAGVCRPDSVQAASAVLFNVHGDLVWQDDSVRVRTRHLATTVRVAPTGSVMVRRGLRSPATPSDRCEAGVVCCSVCGCLLCSLFLVSRVLLAAISTVLTDWAIRAIRFARSERLAVTECDIF